MLYFSQAAYLGIKKKPLFEEEIEMWRLGPVIPEIYFHFRENGNKPIGFEKKSKIKGNLKSFLNAIWDLYGKFSAFQLVEITHSHEPWKKYFLASGKDSVVPKKYLMEYYQDYFLIEDDDED
jgi:uncharacterized phage-associated protein